MSNIIKADAEVVISSSLIGPGGSPYVGVPPTRPTVLPVNLIARNPDIQAPRFVLRRVEGDIFTLTINGMQVVEKDGKVFAVMEGRAQEIVKRLDEPGEIGWIAPTDGSSQIRVGRLREIPTAPPGQYRPEELYNLAFPLE
ncbi:hypothetical protein BKA82DRAFT_35192 [Pisolithus tinctorius]|uniref:Uncharacterized protein n=1 Tax=Pisolithus tinctorius Marx 270 TaxID=870435 RepID=A0A0C3NF25_PISTI|nr:hypothetical protein BKA82DRAFT_35192 [Pisolithus tinctorius]KIN94330.1 hypothetical protein M404DRAFT_35192 [Pisolithus tinctorius Marx 270]KIO12273.1 hypothetical protein M404DRAFT_20097 [Pisolithus tinctorius Marx 270]